MLKKNYMVAKEGKSGVFIFKTTYAPTIHALPSEGGKLRELVPEPYWLTVNYQQILPKTGVWDWAPIAHNLIYSWLKNYCAWPYGVKIWLKMLIYKYKLHFFAKFCIVLSALMTFFNTMPDRLFLCSERTIIKIDFYQWICLFDLLDCFCFFSLFSSNHFFH